RARWAHADPRPHAAGEHAGGDRQDQPARRRRVTGDLPDPAVLTLIEELFWTPDGQLLPEAAVVVRVRQGRIRLLAPRAVPHRTSRFTPWMALLGRAARCFRQGWSGPTRCTSGGE